MGAGLGAPALLRAAKGKRHPIAFSTLGCPAWSWKRILGEASRLGYAAIELRGVLGELDLPKVPELSGSRLAEARRDLAALELAISDLGASATMHEKDAAARRKHLEDGRRFIDLAHALGVPYVRMFGDRLPPDEPREDVMKRIVDGFREMAEYARPAGVVVLVETHGDFTRSGELAEILARVESPGFALLWDAHHTYVTGRERPAQTHAALGSWVRHTHLKDSRAEGDGRKYVLTGTGEVPVQEQVAVLARAGYAGYYCFEWEKRWHPGIEEPEVAFPHYARVMGEYLDAAGKSPA
ncbi:MAG TPA: sugar phosphate isomerase/epimerase family protein [Vicinamibacteria bacterium]|nr:sugar phosphate isomerase/epimerase family protein [Vicinamibacteria bacterium]